MREAITRSMNYLPRQTSEHILRILDAASTLGRNTHENVESLLKKVTDELVVEQEDSDS